MNWASSNEKRFEIKKGKFEDEILEEMIEAERKVDNAERERNQLSEENYRLGMRCDNYEQAFEFSSGSRFYDDSLRKLLSTMPSLPKRPCEVAQLAAKVFSDEIDFSERGWSSLDRCTADLNVLWTALRDIATILHPMLASKESIDVAAEFSSKSRFKYARGEGRQTRKDPKLDGPTRRHASRKENLHREARLVFDRRRIEQELSQTVFRLRCAERKDRHRRVRWPYGQLHDKIVVLRVNSSEALGMHDALDSHQEARGRRRAIE